MQVYPNFSCLTQLLAVSYIPKWGMLSLLRKISSRLGKLWISHSLHTPQDKSEPWLLLLSLRSVSFCCWSLWKDTGCSLEGELVTSILLSVFSISHVHLYLDCQSSPMLTSNLGTFSFLLLLLKTWNEKINKNCKKIMYSHARAMYGGNISAIKN